MDRKLGIKTNKLLSAILVMLIVLSFPQASLALQSISTVLSNETSASVISPYSEIKSSATTETVISPYNTIQSTGATVEVSGPLADFEISVSPPSQAIIQGKTTTYLVSVKSLSGFSSSVSLALSDLPPYSSYSFELQEGVPDFTSKLTITTTSATPINTHNLTIRAAGGGKVHYASVSITIVLEQINLIFDSSIPESNRTYISEVFDVVYPQMVLVYGYPSTYYLRNEVLSITLKYDPEEDHSKYDNWFDTIVVNWLPTVHPPDRYDTGWDWIFSHELTHSFHDALIDLKAQFRWSVSTWVEEGMTEAAARIALLNLELMNLRETTGSLLLYRDLKAYDVWNYTGGDILGVRGDWENKLDALSPICYDCAASMWFILVTELAQDQSYDFLAKVNRQIYNDVNNDCILDDSWIKREVDKVAGDALVEGKTASTWMSSQAITITDPEFGDQLAVCFDIPENPSMVKVIAFQREWPFGKESPKREVKVTIQIVNSSGSGIGITTVDTNVHGVAWWDLTKEEFYPLAKGAYQVIATVTFDSETKVAKNFGLSLGEDVSAEESMFYGVTLNLAGVPVSVDVSATGGDVISNVNGAFIIQTFVTTNPFEITITADTTHKIFAKPNPFTRVGYITLQGSTLGIIAACPVNVLVIDPYGRRIGYDSEINRSVNEIPGATYTGPSPELQMIIIPNPLNGMYDTRLLGTATGTYSVIIELVTMQETMTQTHTGETVEGATYVYNVTISDGVMTADSDPITDLEYLKEFIDGLPNGAFDKPELASQRKNALFNKIDEVILKIEAGNYTDAISKLVHDIRAKMDGDSTAQDWVIDPEMQFKLRVVIDYIIPNIETLQQE